LYHPKIDCAVLLLCVGFVILHSHVSGEISTQLRLAKKSSLLDGKVLPEVIARIEKTGRDASIRDDAICRAKIAVSDVICFIGA